METIWFFLWTLLWAVYFILDGFDLDIDLTQADLSRKVVPCALNNACIYHNRR